MKAGNWKIAIALLLLPLTPVLSAPAADATPASLSVNMIGTGLRCMDLDRSIKFYTMGLGMVVAARLVHGSVSEVMLGFNGNRAPPIIMLLKDDAPGNSPAIEHGNGFSRVMLSVSDAAALSARLSTMGYPVSDLKTDEVNHVKVFWVEDPDGYKYEITERTAPKS
jgi:lactoylglutathione lyase